MPREGEWEELLLMTVRVTGRRSVSNWNGETSAGDRHWRVTQVVATVEEINVGLKLRDRRMWS